MTENERRILTLLSRGRRLSKRDLATKGGMGWATAVKMVARLEEQGFVAPVGTAKKNDGALGKNAYVYDLSSARPRAVGIDVAYTDTQLLLTNLKDETLDTQSLRTPARLGTERFAAFLAEAIGEFLGPTTGDIAGIGIGMPARLIRSDSDVFAQVAAIVSRSVGMHVIVENNIRAYTLFKQRRLFSNKDFVMVTIRTGVGFGIQLGGQLYRGGDGLAGELGHFTVVPDGDRCRCGKRGCLETVVNEKVLYERYRRDVLRAGRGVSAAAIDEAHLVSGLTDLFHRAATGQRVALDVVRAAADYLAYALSSLVLLLNIPEIHISAHFGTAGSLFGDLVSQAMRAYVYPRMPYRIRYEPIDPQGFLLGAAMLVLRDYCDYTIATAWQPRGHSLPP